MAFHADCLLWYLCPICTPPSTALEGLWKKTDSRIQAGRYILLTAVSFRWEQLSTYWRSSTLVSDAVWIFCDPRSITVSPNVPVLGNYLQKRKGVELWIGVGLSQLFSPLSIPGVWDPLPQCCSSPTPSTSDPTNSTSLSCCDPFWGKERRNNVGKWVWSSASFQPILLPLQEQQSYADKTA